MPGDTRRAHKRIEVGRPVELAELDEYGAVVGYTRNLCEGGVRARLEVTPPANANVLVRLFLDEGQEPVEKRGCVVWSAPDVYGDGTEVGLRLLDTEDEEPEASRPPLLPDRVLCVGQAVTISRGGMAYEAVIAKIDEPDADGHICITADTAIEMRDQDSQLAVIQDVEDEIPDAEEWKPHPLRDAWNTVRRYAGPPARIIARWAPIAFAGCAAFAMRLWNKVPAQPRASVESFAKRVGLSLKRFRARCGRSFRALTARAETDEKG